MWLSPPSSRTSRIRSAFSCRMPPRAAAPKRTRELRCPVRPNGIVSIAFLLLKSSRALAPRSNPRAATTGVRAMGAERGSAALETDLRADVIRWPADRGGERTAALHERVRHVGEEPGAAAIAFAGGNQAR